jgi:hypothetical protein
MERPVAAAQRWAVLEGWISDPRSRHRKADFWGEIAAEQREYLRERRDSVRMEPGHVVAWMRYVRVTFKPRVALFASICCAAGGAAWFAVQWRPQHSPGDFEECAGKADHTASTQDERSLLITRCDLQFAGRRKPDGGYTYYDFLQNRHFDIAGPNPTPSELKHFDEEYTHYLDAQRRDAVAVTDAERQNQAQAELGDDRLRGSIIPPGSRPSSIPIPRPVDSAARSKRLCEEAFLSCSLSRFSREIRNFLVSNAKVNRP